MQRFTSWDEIEAHYGSLTPAEEKLKDIIASGGFCVLGNGDEPQNGADLAIHIHADVLRFLLTSPVSHEAVTELGVGVSGAFITDQLNLMDCTIQGNAIFLNCYFDQEIVAERANFQKDLRLNESRFPNLNAAGVTVGGQLACKYVYVSTETKYAINLERSKITQSVLLTDIQTKATVNLSGAHIGGQLDCENGSFSSKNDVALSLQEATIGAAIYFRGLKQIAGRIELIGAHAATLVDDKTSWKEKNGLILDGFTYDRIGGNPPITDHKTRLDWLAHGGPHKDQFYPQPYIQLAKVLKEMGHERDAREIRVALADKLHIQYVNEVKKSLAAPSVHNETLAHLFGWPLIQALNGINWLFKWVVGYGFKPARSVGWLLGMTCVLTFLSFATWRTGEFTPNSAPILVSDDWESFAPLDNAAEQWSTKGKAGQDWETFNSFAYAADIVIPIVEIGQTSAWAPSPARGCWGWALWWARWVFTAAGWIISALGAAAITGVIRRE